MTIRTVLVTGATGQQGGAVARHLLKAGVRVRALTRSATSAAARALAGQGAQVVEGDLDHPATLRAPLDGVDGVFSVQNYYAPGIGFDGEVRQGKALVAAAAAAGVMHFVQSTMAEAPGSERVHHFQSKFAIEAAVRESGLPFTLVGTVWFMDNLLNSKMGGLTSFPFLAGFLSRGQPFEMMAVDDLGGIVAQVFKAPDRFAGRKLDIAGDRLTLPQMKATFRKVVGKRAPPFFIPRWIARRLSPDFAEQLAWQASVGWDFSLEEARAVWPEMRTFSRFLGEHRGEF